MGKEDLSATVVAFLSSGEIRSYLQLFHKGFPSHEHRSIIDPGIALNLFDN